MDKPKKYKLPTIQEFLQKKMICGPKKDPVWVYLEREMRENVAKKPYNEKVGAWLKFLKELKHYFYWEGIKKARRLRKEAGPSWYFELSSDQRNVLHNLKESLHQDLIENLPTRTRAALSELGLTIRIPNNILMDAMKDAVDDPGVFIWNLYTAYFKKPPSELRPIYDINGAILMSSLVFIDLDECLKTLEDITQQKKPPPPKKTQRKNINYQPKVRYGEYLQKMYVPCYSSHPSSEKKKKENALNFEYKFRLRSEGSYEKLCRDTKFLEKRRQRNIKPAAEERVCNYKFFEPPSTLRNSDPKMVALADKLEMIKKRAKPKFSSPYRNVQYYVVGVSFTGNKPNYILGSVSLIPTGYIPINGGNVMYGPDSITLINGHWNFPKEVKEECDETCDCMATWETTVMDYLKESKCTCGHYYDFYQEGKPKETYFYQASRHAEPWFDYAKIYQMDPCEDFIKDTVKEALLSTDPTSVASTPAISALAEKVLVESLLADVADTPLLIPHLPQANLLNNLQEWIRKRLKGTISPKYHKNMILQSQRRWLDLKHMDFRARAYKIPFTNKELKHINWSHRHFIQSLFQILLDDFVTRNRIKQLEQTRLWWSTMKYDAYPGKAFLDVFFTYMPGRMKDILMINPYSSETVPKSGAKTCPLNF